MLPIPVRCRGEILRKLQNPKVRDIWQRPLRVWAYAGLESPQPNSSWTTMRPDEVTRLIRREVDAFTYEVPTRDGLLGVPRSQERMAQEVSALREALTEPNLVPVEIADNSRLRETRMLRVVTRPDSNGYVLVFDQVATRFGLAVVGPSGPPQTIGVWGDLVTTYAAR